MIKLVNYNRTEQIVAICFENKRLYYYWCPEYWYKKLSTWLRKKNYSRAARFLKGLNCEN